MSAIARPSPTALYTWLGQAWPWFRKTSKYILYQFVARAYAKKDWSFMNYGYADLEPKAAPISLHPADEPNRYCIQLYHHVANAIDLDDLDVIEIGSGRGGGAGYVKRYLKPKTMVGVDYSSNAVALCARHHCTDGLAFVTGDAESLPFQDNSFDVIVNVESSHCYSSMDHFISEAVRILRPGGHLLFADFRPQERLAELTNQLCRAGSRRAAGSRRSNSTTDRLALRMLRQTDITPNVIAALDADHARKRAQIERGAPWWSLRLLAQFAGLRGSHIYEQFRSGALVYHSFVLQKPL